MQENLKTWYNSKQNTAIFIVGATLLITLLKPSFIPKPLGKFLKSDLVSLVVLLLVAYYARTMTSEGLFGALLVLILYIGISGRISLPLEPFDAVVTGDRGVEPASFNVQDPRDTYHHLHRGDVADEYGPHFSAEYGPHSSAEAIPCDLDDITGFEDDSKAGADFNQSFGEPVE